MMTAYTRDPLYARLKNSKIKLGFHCIVDNENKIISVKSTKIKY